ncbi:MAG: NAD(P)/FAD-dependent oxidoreductase, partial [Acinetobacter sp.]
MEKAKQKIVIVGGGFGGIELAKRLRKENVDVIILDKHNYHTFQPLLYQVAT